MTALDRYDAGQDAEERARCPRAVALAGEVSALVRPAHGTTVRARDLVLLAAQEWLASRVRRGKDVTAAEEAEIRELVGLPREA